MADLRGGGIDGAHKRSLAYAMPDGPRFWLNPSFWISLLLLAMPIMLLVDVFYVTDLLGAQITSPSRQAAIKRALLPLFVEEERKTAKAG